MKLHVDFHNFRLADEAFLRDGILRSSLMCGCHWIEWSAGLHPAPPDISLIYADDLSWFEAARVSNLVSGRSVILVGAESPRVGLPIVSFPFKWSELPLLAGIEGVGDVVLPLVPIRFASTIPGGVACLARVQN